jgi:hypothetical protein
MDPIDPDFWRRQWEAFSSAPIACLGFLAVGAVAAWWFRGSVDQRETKGLRAQIDVLEQRVKLATEQEQAAIKATRSAKAQLDAFDMKLGNLVVRERALVEKAKQAVRDIERTQEEVLGTLQPSNIERSLVANIVHKVAAFSRSHNENR